MLPDIIPAASGYEQIRTRDAFIQDVIEGIKEAPMSIRLTPHILSVIDWSRPLQDPIRRQFIPMKSAFLPDHPKLSMDSLHETNDSPVTGLVHRYPDKVLFLGMLFAFSDTPTTLSYSQIADLENCSHFRLSTVLSLLYSVVLRRRQHRLSNKEVIQADPTALGSHVGVYRKY